MSGSSRQGRDRKAGVVATACAAVVVGMVGLSYAAVPLYEMFCAVTGYGGTTQRAEAGADQVLDREITVRFDANVARDLSWDVEPDARRMTLRIGETGETFYLARNLSDGASVGTSTFNVSPPQAGLYFNKIECFCFTEQVLQPGERVQMPVSFFVDPEIVNDGDAKFAKHITLSYTFYEIDLPEDVQAALDTDSGAALPGGAANENDAPASVN